MAIARHIGAKRQVEIVLVLFCTILAGCGNSASGYSQQGIEQALVGIVKSEWDRLPAKGAIRVVVNSSESTQHSNSPFAKFVGQEALIEFSIANRYEFDLAVKENDQTYFSVASDGATVKINGTEAGPIRSMLENEKLSEDVAVQLQPYYVVTQHLFPLSDGLIVTPEAFPALVQKNFKTYRATYPATGNAIGVSYGMPGIVENHCFLQMGDHPLLWKMWLDVRGNTVRECQFSNPVNGNQKSKNAPFSTMNGTVDSMTFVSTLVDDN